MLLANLLINIDGNNYGAMRALNAVDSAFLSTLGNAESFARGMATATLTAATAVGILGAASIKLAIDYESSFAGIRKTVDATGGQFDQISEGLRNLAKEIPVGVNELNRIGEAAGQLGVGAEDIVEFTRVAAEMGVTTNLSSLAAADGMARFANVMQMPLDKIENLGSTIVDLGNKLAATEAEIVNYGERLAGAGHIAGMAEPEILAIGAAMASVGVKAEAGGTAVQKVILAMATAVQEGGNKLRIFGQISGTTAEGFKTLWGTDSAEAFTRFVEGLGREGDNAISVLKDLDLNDARLVRAFLNLAGAGDLLRESITIGNNAWAENNALANEAGERFKTAESRLHILVNRFQDAAISLGQQFLPYLVETAIWLGERIPQAAAWIQEEMVPEFLVVAGAAMAFANVMQTVATFLSENEGLATNLAHALAATTIEMVAIGAALIAVGVISNPFVLLAVGMIGFNLAAIELVQHMDDITGAIDAVGDALFSLSDPLFAAIDGFLDFGSRALSAFTEGWSGADEAVDEQVRALIQAAKDAMDDFASMMYEAGSDAITGLIDGLESAVGDAIGFVADIPGWLVDGIQDAARGHSPWEITEPLGGDMIAGIIVGINEMIPTLTAAAVNAVSVATGAAAQQAAADIMSIQSAYAAIAAGGPIQTIGPLNPNATAYVPTIEERLAATAKLLDFGKGGPTAYGAGQVIGIGQKAYEQFLNRVYGSGYGNLPGIDDEGTYVGGGSGGGGGGGAEKAAEDAATIFAEAWSRELQSGALADAFGETGTKLLESFSDALDSPSAAGRLPDIITKLIGEAEAEGVPNAKELGANLAAAIGEGLKSGDFGGVQAAVGEMNDAIKAAGKLTVESFATAVHGASTDRKVTEQIGAAGKSLMDQLDKALTEGGKKNIEKLADMVDALTGKLTDKAPEGQAAFLGTSLMTAMENAIKENSPAAMAALGDALAKINAVMMGGAIDIRTGTIIAADAIKELAKAFKTDGATIVENIQAIIDSGLSNWITALDKIPESARKALQDLFDLLEQGAISIDQFKDKAKGVLPGGGGTQSPGDTSGIFPGASFEEEVARLFGPGARFYDPSGREVGARDFASITDLVRAVQLRGYTTKNVLVPHMSDGMPPEGWYDSDRNQYFHHDVDSKTPGNQPGWTQAQFAMGTDYVPYDGMRAILHRGERILRAGQNGGSERPNVNLQVTVTGPVTQESLPLMTREFKAAVEQVIDQHWGHDAQTFGVPTWE